MRGFDLHPHLRQTGYTCALFSGNMVTSIARLTTVEGFARVTDDLDFAPNNNQSEDIATAVALEHFARYGYDETRLDTIAQESAISKRMIHYYFGDKQGLYVRALQLAIKLLRPLPQAMELDSTVPVDAVVKVVEAIVDQMASHPMAVRMVVLENLFGHANMKNATPLADQSSIVLQLDKILMLGQDSGAFRPGVSALDVYAIISSMSMFRVTNPATFANLYATDLRSEDNAAGMKRLVVDAVLSFLTSNMQPHGAMSYLVQENHADRDSSIYDES